MTPAARKTALRLLILMLALLAASRAVYESRKLLFGQTYWDANDLKNFHNQVVTWLAGEDLYATVRLANYPPASYPLMFPMYVLDNDINRWVWFSHAVVVLGLLSWMCVAESGAEGVEEKLFVAVLPLAMFSTGVVLGTAQLSIHALAASTAGILLLYNSRGRWAWELAAAACMLFALIKPSLTAPFFWIFLLIPRRKHAAVYVIVGYILLTLLGSSFLPGNLVEQFRSFMAKSTVVAENYGYGDVPLWLTKTGYANLIAPFTLLGLLAMGGWILANRRADRWLLFGGLALMTRVWAYHQMYDDMLNLIAFVALIRLAKGLTGDRQPDQFALVVLLIGLTTVPGPASPLKFWNKWSPLLCGWHTAVRFLMLGVIVHRTWMHRNDAQEHNCDASQLVRE